jgi:hypothetical protein
VVLGAASPLLSGSGLLDRAGACHRRQGAAMGTLGLREGMTDAGRDAAVPSAACGLSVGEVGLFEEG